MISRRVVFGILAGLSTVWAWPQSQTLAQAQHWLVGEWVGQRDQGTTTRYGSDRTLTVTRVAADGKSAQAIWSANGKLPLALTIDGERVSFSTTRPTISGANYKLERKGDALVGTYTNSAGGKSATSSWPGKNSLWPPRSDCDDQGAYRVR